MAVVEFFADPEVASAIVQGPDLAAQLVFTPLLAAWSIWVGIALSTRVTDPRTSQQLSILVSLPTVAVTSLIAFNVIHADLKVAVILRAVLLALTRIG